MPEQKEPEEEAGDESPVFDDEDYLREQYHGEGKTQSEIAEEHGITASTVSHYMKKYGIETRGHQVTDERLDDPEWLGKKYIDEDMTMQEIAEEVGCSDGTVMRRLRKHGVIDTPDKDDEADEEIEADDESEDDESEE